VSDSNGLLLSFVCYFLENGIDNLVQTVDTCMFKWDNDFPVTEDTHCCGQFITMVLKLKLIKGYKHIGLTKVLIASADIYINNL
jgi:hypothetical protein